MQFGGHFLSATIAVSGVVQNVYLRRIDDRGGFVFLTIMGNLGLREFVEVLFTLRMESEYLESSVQMM